MIKSSIPSPFTSPTPLTAIPFHWNSRFSRFASEIAAYLNNRQQLEQAIAFLQTTLNAEYLAEGIYRQLMLFYQHLGRKAEGIEIYNRCRNTLSARLGTEPSPETNRIYEELMAAKQVD